jgi:hypothetical protein
MTDAKTTPGSDPRAASRYRKLFELLRQENLAARNITVSMTQRVSRPARARPDDMAQFARQAEQSLQA